MRCQRQIRFSSTLPSPLPRGGRVGPAQPGPLRGAPLPVPALPAPVHGAEHAAEAHAVEAPLSQAAGGPPGTAGFSGRGCVHMDTCCPQTAGEHQGALDTNRPTAAGRPTPALRRSPAVISGCLGDRMRARPHVS